MAKGKPVHYYYVVTFDIRPRKQGDSYSAVYRILEDDFGARRPAATVGAKNQHPAVGSVWILKSDKDSSEALLDSIHATMVVCEAVGQLPKGLAVSRLRLFAAHIGSVLDDVRVVVSGRNLEVDVPVAE